MTGWTWAHVHDEVTLPQVQVLQAYWRTQPPMPVLAARLCAYFGIKVGEEPKRKAVKATSVHDVMRDAIAAGLPVMQGRPDDPILDFLDL